MNQPANSHVFAIESLTDAHGKVLKDIAFESIRAKITGLKYLPSVEDHRLREKAGVFVTLREFGELRGCIGYAHPYYELWEATSKAAVHAAISDPRFDTVREEEVENLEIEISVLGPLQRIEIHDPLDIGILRIGAEGLVVEGLGRSGLLLPQVAIENAMDSMEFLSATCEKAGLSDNAWRFPGVSVYKFEAKIF